MGEEEAINESTIPQKTAEDYLNKVPYTDEQLIHIAQSMQLELAINAKNNLDLKRASSVMALSGVIKAISDSAQANIKNKIESGNQGAIEGAAAKLAGILKAMHNPDDLPFVDKNRMNTGEAPILDLDNEPLQSVHGNTFVGVEHLNEKDFLDKPVEE